MLALHHRVPGKEHLERFIESDNLSHDIVTLVLSYAFILVAAWNDDLLGLPANPYTAACEYVLAAALAAEIVLRLVYARDRRWYFYPLIVIDAVAVLTVFPSFVYVTFARIVRLLVSGGRMLQLIDKISRSRGNPYLILLIYPLIVPIAAALFYIFESRVGNSNVSNYFEALVTMLSYSLTVGLASNHPVTIEGKAVAGLMLLAGLMCISIVGNALTDRYTILRSEQVKPKDDIADGD
jgi:voltage-gated potassium channel